MHNSLKISILFVRVSLKGFIKIKYIIMNKHYNIRSYIWNTGEFEKLTQAMPNISLRNTNRTWNIIGHFFLNLSSSYNDPTLFFHSIRSSFLKLTYKRLKMKNGIARANENIMIAKTEDSISLPFINNNKI